MHGFCPHRDLKRRKGGRRSGDEREEEKEPGKERGGQRRKRRDKERGGANAVDGEAGGWGGNVIIACTS